MRYRQLGNSGLRVSELCLGTMGFGEEMGWGSDKVESLAAFRAFAEAGGNFIDTANIYTRGTSERYLGEFVSGSRNSYVLSTKYTGGGDSLDPNASGNHRKNLRQSLEESLKRLNTDYIDMYWVHTWDFLTPQDEVMRALDDVVRSGKVLYIGISDTPAWVVSRANMLAEMRGWSSFVALQAEYSLIERTPERELLTMAGELNLSTLAWGSLGMGVLSGKYERGAEAAMPGKRPIKGGRLNERTLLIAHEVGEVARECSRSSAQVATCWVRQRQAGVIPIIGARTAAQVADSLASLELKLSDEQCRRLDAISQIDLGFPYDFYESRGRLLALGESGARIDTENTFWGKRP